MSRFFVAAVVLVTLTAAACTDEPLAPELSTSEQRLTELQAVGRPVQLTCGQVITESVALANDLLDCPENGIVVGADGIVIDGRGHTVDGVLAAVTWGVLIDGHTGVTVKNIRITEFTIGVGILNSSESRVLRSEIALNDLDGVLFMAAHDNEVAHNAFDGNAIAVNVTASSTGNQIVQNRIVDPRFGNGIQLTSVSGTVVVGNRIRNGSLNLQTTTGNRIERNRIDGAVVFGVSIRGPSRQNVLENNRVTGVNGDGFLVFGITAVIAPADNTLIGNRASGNTGDGFRVSGAVLSHTFTRNVSEENGGFGFRDQTTGSGTAGTANTYDRNRCRNNDDGPSTPAGLCRASGEGG
jgi:nitrous oxidase accessory protein NosD